MFTRNTQDVLSGATGYFHGPGYYVYPVFWRWVGWFRFW
jgi:hypothetical protein